MRKAVYFVLLLVVAGLGIHSCATDEPFAPGLFAAILLLLIVPGMAIYILSNDKRNLLELALSAVVLSPILTGAAAVVLISLGMAVKTTAVAILSASTTLGAAALFSKSAIGTRGTEDGGTGITARQGWILVGIIVAFCVLVGYYPRVSEWWGLRTDGYFHVAVISQIEHYGVPPEDPYFFRLPLQYMWFFHVLAIVVSEATNVHPSFTMPVFNIQTLIGYILATYLLSVQFRKRFEYGVSSVLAALLGLNAVFWFFMPIKLGRALTGDVTGFDAIMRLLSLRPFDLYTIRSFLDVFYNQRFFLDKFLVMTPFSFGLCFMAAAWYGTVTGYARRNTYSMVFTLIVCAGMLAFHPAVGFAVVAGLGGGHVLLLLTRSKVTDRSFTRTSLLFIGALALGAILVSPYLYLLMQGKESDQLLPFGVSFKRTMGIVISCGLVAFLSAWQVRRLLAERTPQARFFLLAALSVTVVSLLVVLPGPNKYGKPPFFVFYPLAVAGGWTLVDLARKGKPIFRKKSVIALIYILLFVPVNLLALTAYFNTPPEAALSPWEREVVTWVRANTSRDAVFIDSGGRVFLLTEGPRRYYFGFDAYADQWGYDRTEMDRRKRVIENVYSASPLENSTLAAFAGIEPDVYIISREGETGPGKLSRTPDVVDRVFESGPITVWKVNKQALPSD
jgi:hypothetical protein